MSAEDIVSRLDYVRQTAPGTWIARCVAHDDNGPSLSIKDAGGGRTLIHCHAGCSALDVLTALGLDWDALYPPTDRNYSPTRRQETVDELVIAIAAANLREGKVMSREDRDRAAEAMRRVGGKKASPEGPDVEANAEVVARRYAEKTEREMARLRIMAGGES